MRLESVCTALAFPLLLTALFKYYKFVCFTYGTRKRKMRTVSRCSIYVLSFKYRHWSVQCNRSECELWTQPSLHWPQWLVPSRLDRDTNCTNTLQNSQCLNASVGARVKKTVTGDLYKDRKECRMIQKSVQSFENRIILHCMHEFMTQI